MFEEVRQAFALLGPSTRRPWIAQLPLALLSAAAETVGAIAVLALLRILTDPRRPPPFRSPRGSTRAFPDAGSVTRACGVVITLVYLVRYGVLLVATAQSNRIAHDSTRELADRVLHRFLDAPYVESVPPHLGEDDPA